MNEESRAIWLRRTMAIFGLLLFAITWRLWTPQTDFPQIPFFGWLRQVPGFVDWIAAAGTVVGLIAMLSTKYRWAKPAIILFVVSTSLLILLNQHRLQPWAYLMLVTSCLLVCLPNKTSLIWVRRIVISIYIYSAISKFDYQFVFTVGEQMLNVLLGFVHLETTGLPQWLQISLVLCLPMSELLIGCLLLFSKTRKFGGWLAIGLHTSLLLVLGPLGLNHQPGVLIWNAWFIVQAWLLFASVHSNKNLAEPENSEDLGKVAVETSPTSGDTPSIELIWLGRLLASFVIVFPITCAVSPWVELPMKADHWVAWEVYAPRSSRATAQIPAWTSSDPTLDQPSFDTTPQSQTPNQWSLNMLGVPVYPQDRFQAACWLSLTKEQALSGGRSPTLTVSGTANRFTGEREQIRIDGPVAAQKYRRKLWLNTLPRWD